MAKKPAPKVKRSVAAQAAIDKRMAAMRAARDKKIASAGNQPAAPAIIHKSVAPGGLSVDDNFKGTIARALKTKEIPPSSMTLEEQRLQREKEDILERARGGVKGASLKPKGEGWKAPPPNPNPQIIQWGFVTLADLAALPRNKVTQFLDMLRKQLLLLDGKQAIVHASYDEHDKFFIRTEPVDVMD